MEHRRILVDTSLFIEYFRKKNKEKTKLFLLVEREYQITTSAICHFEYMAGSRHQDFDKLIFEHIEILPFDVNQSIIAAETFRELKRRNTLIEFRDILIASAAISERIPLATLNIKHFERIETLNLYMF